MNKSYFISGASQIQTCRGGGQFEGGPRPREFLEFLEFQEFHGITVVNYLPRAGAKYEISNISIVEFKKQFKMLSFNLITMHYCIQF